MLADSTSTREETYYPAIRSLLLGVLQEQGLPFEVRVTTSERRPGGGIDLPDVALYDGAGAFLAVCGEVKTPDRDLEEMAKSTDRGDQLGRYLAQTRVVLLSNVRGFGLLTARPGAPAGPVAPELRRLEQVVELWPTTHAMSQGGTVPKDAASLLAELVETAVTRFASIAEPESLARILARQARRAKAALPDRFSAAVQDLLDDFGKALGITFEGGEGEEFFRSSLVQTAYYGLFAGWALWRHSKEKKPFRWEDLSDYLRIPFLGELFYEFRHPKRLRELNLAEHLNVATETLARVDADRFFARFQLASLRPGPPEVHAPGSAHAAATPAITYFYEPFLEAFDPGLRKELGVWYTPSEIVRYQVRRVEQLLRDELGCARGFADPRVVVLDPCCGTGAYLVGVLQCVAEQLDSEGVQASLGAELLDAACRRFLGFEILTAPFVVAQLQIYLMLAELGATPDVGHRPAVFLTNALTGWNGRGQLKLHFPEMQQEHDAADRVKNEAKIIVILASERTPQGESCETIFNVEGGGPGIKVGTAISTFVKTKDSHGRAVFVRDFWGRAEAKRRALLDSLEMHHWTDAHRSESAAASEGPRAYEKATPTEAAGWRFTAAISSAEFEAWPSLDDLFLVRHQGVNPNRGLDGSLIDTDRDVLATRMAAYYSNMPLPQLQEIAPALMQPRARYDPSKTRAALQGFTKFRRENLVPYLLFPLDVRWIYYETGAKLLNERRSELWDSLDNNVFLLTVPQPRRTSEALPVPSGCLFDLHVHDRGSVGFPAWTGHALFTRKGGRQANLAEPVWRRLKASWSLKGDLTSTAAGKVTRALFGLALVVGHSPAYQDDHRDGLAQDWLHLPIPRDRKLIQEAEAVGQTVATLLDPQKDAARAIREILGRHARELGVLSVRGADRVSEEELLVEHSFYGAAPGAWSGREATDTEALRAEWGKETGDLSVNPTVYFRNVPERVWRFELGGYPVLKKWLGYREAKRRGDRPLTLAEAQHFRSMVQRIAALLVLHAKLDEVYARVAADALSLDDLGLT